jgi:hypothetical protein
MVCKTMFITIQSTQFWYKQTMSLHVQHDSAYCDHYQVRTAFTVILLLSAITPYTGYCLYSGSVLYRCIVYVIECWRCVDLALRDVSEERRLTQDLRSATSQKATIFTVTAVKASNCICCLCYRMY